MAPALTGAVFLIAWCKSSDHFRERGFHITTSTVISLVGYILLGTVDTTNTSVLYFAMFLCTIGVSSRSSLKFSCIDRMLTVNPGIPNGYHRFHMDCYQHSQFECPCDDERLVYLHWKLWRSGVEQYLSAKRSTAIHYKHQNKYFDEHSCDCDYIGVFSVDEVGEQTTRQAGGC